MIFWWYHYTSAQLLRRPVRMLLWAWRSGMTNYWKIIGHCGPRSLVFTPILPPSVWALTSRDSNGMWKLPLMQLILPYKISCIMDSSHIPLLSLLTRSWLGWPYLGGNEHWAPSPSCRPGVTIHNKTVTQLCFNQMCGPSVLCQHSWLCVLIISWYPTLGCQKSERLI